MSVATKLAIINEAQDRASNTLQSVRDHVAGVGAEAKRVAGEMDKLEDMDRGRMAQVRAARAQRLAAMAKDKERIERLERSYAAAAGATTSRIREQSTALGGLTDMIGQAGKAQGVFNKVVGAFGFAGVIAGAATALVGLIDLQSQYSKSLDEVTERATQYASALEKIAKYNEETRRKGLSEAERDRLERLDKANAKLEDYVELQQEVAVIEAALASARAEIAKEEAKIAGILERQGAAAERTWAVLGARSTIRTIEQQIAPLLERQAEASRQLDTAAQNIRKEQRETTTLYAAQQRAIGALEKGVERIGTKWSGVNTIVQSLGKTIDNVFGRVGEVLEDKLIEEPKKKAEEERRRRQEEAARNAATERQRATDEVRRMEDDMARRRVLLEAEGATVGRLKVLQLERSLVEREFAERRITALQRITRLEELQLRQAELYKEIQREGVEALKAEEKAREQAARDRARTLEQDGRERERQRRDAAAAALAERARAIEELGAAAARVERPLAALDERLEGLGSTIRDTAAVWARYETGQESLGSAIAGTMGQVGSQVAQAIEDRQAQAVIEGGFNAAASIAAFAGGNVPAGLGHAKAAAAFFALAGAGGGTPAGGASGGSASSAATTSSARPVSDSSSRARGDTGRQVTIVQQFGNGLVFGMAAEVGKASAQAAESLRGSGMYRRRF